MVDGEGLEQLAGGHAGIAFASQEDPWGQQRMLEECRCAECAEDCLQTSQPVRLSAKHPTHLLLDDEHPFGPADLDRVD